MKLIPLSIQERITTGASHKVVITYEDLTDTAGTAKTLVPFTDGQARDIVNNVRFDLVTPFDGGSTSALALDFGYNGASVDDADAFIDAVEIHKDATEILASLGVPAAPATDTVDGTYGTEESTVITSLRNTINFLRAREYAAQETFQLEAVFTATGANLDTLTTGEVHIYFNLVRLADLR